MKVVLFGIEDGLLRAFEEEALRTGCSLEICNAAAQDKTLIEKFTEGAELIVSGTLNDAELVATIIAAAEKNNVKRLIQISGTEVKNENDRFSLRFFALNLYRRMKKKNYIKHLMAAKEVETSKLDWTIVRCPIIDKGPKQISTRVGYVSRYMKLKLSPGNIAAFILREGRENRFIKRAICISSI